MDGESRTGEPLGAAHLQRRPAHDADRFWLDDLRRAVYRDLFDATWGGWDEARHRRHFSSCWERGGIEVLLAEGQPIGMLQIEIRADAVELVELQIQPAQQGIGWGTRVVRELQERARREGRRLVLGTGLHNLGAQRLYLRLGFRETSRSATHVHLEWRAPAAPPLT